MARETTQYLQRKIDDLLGKIDDLLAVRYSADSPVRYALAHSTSMATRAFLPLRSSLHILHHGVVVSKPPDDTQDTYTVKLFPQQLLKVSPTMVDAWNMLVRDDSYSVVLYHSLFAPHGRRVPQAVLRALGSKLMWCTPADLAETADLTPHSMLTVRLWNIECAPTNAHAYSALDSTIHKRWIPIVANQGMMHQDTPDCHLCAFQSYAGQWARFVGVNSAGDNCPGCPLSEFDAEQNCLASTTSAFASWSKLRRRLTPCTATPQDKTDAAQRMLDVLYDVRQHFWHIPSPSISTETPTKKGTA